jgi:hypothetical protein
VDLRQVRGDSSTSAQEVVDGSGISLFSDIFLSLGMVLLADVVKCLGDMRTTRCVKS